MLEKEPKPTIDERTEKAKRRATAYFTGDKAGRNFVAEAKALVSDDYEHFLVSEKTSEGIYESEYECCRDLVAVLRSDTWLSAWFKDQIGYAARGWKPTPAMLMQELVEPAAHFALDIKNATRLLEQHPDLLGVVTDLSD